MIASQAPPRDFILKTAGSRAWDKKIRWYSTAFWLALLTRQKEILLNTRINIVAADITAFQATKERTLQGFLCYIDNQLDYITGQSKEEIDMNHRKYSFLFYMSIFE
jgi:hypothetical protein